jgi:16S rRNA (guanine(966)-N(2))-methyltransferase RsmD
MRIIAGTARGRKIEAPEGKNTRPTLDRVRENLFNILQMNIRGSRVLDLFAGSGALSIEALSRGAESATMVDSDRNANRIQRKNLESLGFAGQAEVLLRDWKQAAMELTREGRRYDLVFLDPPYRMTDLREVFSALEGLLEEDGIVILEHEAKAEISAGDAFSETDRRQWGYCGVSFYRLSKNSGSRMEGEKA